MDREEQSGRLTVQRQQQAETIAKQEKEIAGLKNTIVGLSSLVAAAHAAGYLHAKAPEDA